MSRVENPAAFPSVEEHPSFDFPMHHFGMTLRDYFAAAALPSVIVKCAGDTRARELGISAYFAMNAYEIADAMLAERAKGDGA